MIMAAHSASLTVFLCFGREVSSYNTPAMMLLWLNNSSIWGLEDTSSGNETWVFTRSNAYLPPRVLCQELLQLYGRSCQLGLTFPDKITFLHFTSFPQHTMGGLFDNVDRKIRKGDGERAERAGFVGGSFFILGENGAASMNPLSQGHCCHLPPEPRCPLPALCGSSPSLERVQLPSSSVCDITELCSPEALNGVFVTACVGCLRC